MPDDLDFDPTLRGMTPGLTFFDRFTLVRILGRGGMGVVWLAKDARLDREVALKFLPETVQGDKAALDDLRRETKRSLELTHPNIVRIYDLVEDGRAAAIAMEYVDGQSLSDMRLERTGRAFDAAEIARWISDLCDVLTYAHESAKLVHRDIKPANLMITSAGKLKVADFGISRRLSDSMSLLSQGPAVSGTLAYMSPQQLAGGDAKVTDDIYSVGPTLYDLLTGRSPFHTGDISLQIRESLPPPISERRAELGFNKKRAIPKYWEETIAACMAKGAAHRPQNAKLLKQMLDGSIPPPAPPAVAADATITPNDLEPQRQAGPPLPNSWPVLIGLLTLLIALLVSLGWMAGRNSGRLTAANEQQAAVDAAVKAGAIDAFAGHAAGEIRTDKFAGIQFAWIPQGSAKLPIPSKATTEDGSVIPKEMEFTSGGFWMAVQDSFKETDVPASASKLVRTRLARMQSSRDLSRMAQLLLLTLTERESGRLPETWSYAIPSVSQWKFAAADLLAHKESELGPRAKSATNKASGAKPEGIKANQYGLLNLIGGAWEQVMADDVSIPQLIHAAQNAFLNNSGSYSNADGAGWNLPNSLHWIGGDDSAVEKVLQQTNSPVHFKFVQPGTDSGTNTTSNESSLFQGFSFGVSNPGCRLIIVKTPQLTNESIHLLLMRIDPRR